MDSGRKRPCPPGRPTVNKTTVFVVASVLLLAAGRSLAGDPAIRLQRPPAAARDAFEVTGLDPADLARLGKADFKPAQWSALFVVQVSTGAAKAEAPPLLGSYRVTDAAVVFEPRFPLTGGLRYRATFRPALLPGHAGDKAKPLTAEFALPRPAVVASTVVEQVYPTGERLPENQLKFYIHFSAPMSRGEAYRHIRLLNEKGQPVEQAFLELGEELWDPQGRRFTLFIQPGRIKKGLRPREELGPVLEAGKSYTLVIDRDWPDAKDNPLKESYRKSFRAGAAVEEGVDVKAWKLEPPAAGTTAALVVTFPRPLDHALLERCLTVTDAAGRAVPGSVAVGGQETRCQFTPEKPWAAGEYQLVVDAVLEDLAGNRIGRPFEVDVFRPIPQEVKAETVKLPFRVAR
jgi:hypothetical protein